MKIMDQRTILLNKQVKNHFIIYILGVLFVSLLLVFSYKKYSYSILQVTGLYNCDDVCGIKMTLPYDKVQHIQKDIKIKYQDNIYQVENIIFDEPYLNKEIPYQDITIESELVSEEKIINFKILYDRKKIITKIKDLVIGR